MNDDLEWYCVKNSWFEENGIYKATCNHYTPIGRLALCLPRNTGIPKTADLFLVYVVTSINFNYFTLSKVYTNGTIDDAMFQYNSQPLYEVPSLLGIKLKLGVDFSDPI